MPQGVWTTGDPGVETVRGVHKHLDLLDYDLASVLGVTALCRAT